MPKVKFIFRRDCPYRRYWFREAVLAELAVWAEVSQAEDGEVVEVAAGGTPAEPPPGAMSADLQAHTRQAFQPVAR